MKKHHHPARYTKAVWDVMCEYLPPGDLTGQGRAPIILDPMAGTGERLGTLRERGYNPIGIELEECYIEDPCVVVGDATKLDLHGEKVGAVMVSPAYANRLRDKHKRNDPCKRCAGVGHLGPDSKPPADEADWGRTCDICNGGKLSPRKSYTHAKQDILGDPDAQLEPNNSGGMPFNEAYRTLHEVAWAKAVHHLVHNGVFILNVKNFQVGDRVGNVAEWHIDTLISLGLTLERLRVVDVHGLRKGTNRDKREDHEFVAVFRNTIRAEVYG